MIQRFGKNRSSSREHKSRFFFLKHIGQRLDSDPSEMSKLKAIPKNQNLTFLSSGLHKALNPRNQDEHNRLRSSSCEIDTK